MIQMLNSSTECKQGPPFRHKLDKLFDTSGFNACWFPPVCSAQTMRCQVAGQKLQFSLGAKSAGAGSTEPQHYTVTISPLQLQVKALSHTLQMQPFTLVLLLVVI